ncbi:uncharacterized protein LOC114947081 [Acropora millepora]|uniref:uncharacterized protein LOC114947081 n=1 Tax=Acropora millepora TaxID=45264 RepID=UPI001CF39E0C|nr:uncharacterized protein LOC114947081 [Acropora millepora]
MSFEMNGVAIHSQLLEKYAKLSSAGGYELLLYQRFHHLPPPHSPSRIKEIANSSVVYIRPLQRDILDTEDSSIDNVVNPAQEAEPKVKCLQCDEEIEMGKVRNHQEQHHHRKRKRQSSIGDHVNKNSDGDRDDPLTLLSTSSAEPTTSTACTAEEDIDKLSEMFSNESRKELEKCLKLQGCVYQAVITTT